MTICVDVQLSPTIAKWINENFKHIQASSVRSLGLRDASDPEIFRRAKEENAIIMTKDSDFLQYSEQVSGSPKVIFITCGNTTNSKMKSILNESLPKVIELLNKGETLVEISST